MSHIIKNEIIRVIGKSYVAVKVKVDGSKLIVQSGSIMLVKPDTLIAQIPKKFKVYNSEGEEILPLNNFFITVDTINPYHLVLDI